ncbi:MAG: AAA family ATPase [Epsilonproteobacteria bacterium]|nr:AAA family ATPase [Campylobacterota bacterium]
MRKKLESILLLFLLFNTFLFASVAQPLLVEGGESFEEIEKFTIGSGHNNVVRSVAFSPDGKTIISGSHDRSIKLWDVQKKELLHTFEGHSQIVISVAFSPDGKTIISGSSDNSIKLWDVQKKELLYTFEGHGSTVSSVAFSPDGKTILSGSLDNSVKLWDVEKKVLLHSFEGHSNSVTSVAFPPDGKTILSGSSDNSVKLWDVQKRALIHTFEGHSSDVTSVAFSPDGKTILSGSWDKSVKFWDVQKRALIHTFEGHGSYVYSVAFSFDGKTILSGSGDKSVKLWNVEKRELLYSFKEYSDYVYSVAFSPDGKRILSGSSDNSVKLWDVQKRELLCTLNGYNNSVTSIAFSPDGKRILLGSSDNRVKLWDVEKRELLYSFEGHNDSVTSVAFSPDNKLMLSTSKDESIMLWDIENKVLLHTFEGHDYATTSIAFSPDGKRFLSGSEDTKIKLWNVETKELLYTFEGNNKPITSVVFSPDGKRFLSGSEDARIKFWDLETRELLYTFYGHKNSITSVVFSPDGKRFLSGSKDARIKFWDLETKELLHTFEGHSRAVTSVAFSPNGTMFLSGSWDSNITLWDVETKKLHRTFEGNDNYITSVVFSPDGTRVLSGSKDNRVKLWDIEKKEFELIADIYIIGSNWAWFDKLSKEFKRVDDGTLVMLGDKPLTPSDNTLKDKLEITTPKQVELYSQKTTTIEENITNLADKPSYWIECYSEDDNILVYTNQIMRLDPKETKTLKIKLSSALPNKNLEPFSRDVELKFMTANGDYITKTIKVNFKTPKLEIKEAKYNSEDKSLLVEVINSGNEAIKDLDIKIGKDTQTIEELNASVSIQKSFVLATKPSEVNVSISKPFYEWYLHSEITVEEMYFHYTVLVVLIVGLLLAVYYYRRYRHPLLVKLERGGNLLSTLSLDELDETIGLLKKIARLDDVLKVNRLSSSKLEKIIAFTQAKDDLSKVFIEITQLKLEGNNIGLALDFALNIENIKLDGSANIEKLKNSKHKVLAISNDREMQNSLAEMAKNKKNLVVAPNYEELSKMFFSQSVNEELVTLFSNTLNLKDISPYQIAGDVKKENMFFGRVEIISNIINSNPHNYIVVGARQLGKSSLLKALDREYKDREMLSYYITLDEESDLVYHLSKALGVSRDMDSVQEAIYRSEKTVIFLIDEVDKFLKLSENSEKFTSIFRSLAQGDKAYFILAGYWELYKETLKDKSPLRNFGNIITLGGLEEEACRELITKPMKSMGISYESPKIIENIIHKTGRRSNLVSVVCDRLVSTLKEKRITQEELESVLSGGFVEYISMPKEKLDRVIVYATITKESFYQEELYDVFDKFGLDVDSREIEESLFRLELSFVIVKVDGKYRYRVPLFVDKVKEGTRDFEKVLLREVEEFKRSRIK